MAERDISLIVNKLREEGNTVWSYSRLTTFHNCKYSYKLAYVDGIRGKENIYSVLGSLAHDILEEAYNTKKFDKDKAKIIYTTGVNKAIDSGMRFSADENMHSNIYKNYITSMNHYFDNFKLEDFKSKQEGLLIKHLFGNNYIQGYYDQIRNYNGIFEVIDFKTSTKFKTADRKEKARQLLLYADIINQQGSNKIGRVAWAMLKYCVISYTQKNGKVKETITARHEIIKTMEKMLTKDLANLDIDMLVANMLIRQAYLDNSLDCMPKEIIDKYTIKDWYDYYEYTQEDIDEVYNFIEETILAISVEKEWTPNTSSSYFCNSLCGHKDICPAIQLLNEKYKEQTLPSDLDDLL